MPLLRWKHASIARGQAQARVTLEAWSTSAFPIWWSQQHMQSGMKFPSQKFLHHILLFCKRTRSRATSPSLVLSHFRRKRFYALRGLASRRPSPGANSRTGFRLIFRLSLILFVRLRNPDVWEMWTWEKLAGVMPLHCAAVVWAFMLLSRCLGCIVWVFFVLFPPSFFSSAEKGNSVIINQRGVLSMTRMHGEASSVSCPQTTSLQGQTLWWPSCEILTETSESRWTSSCPRMFGCWQLTVPPPRTTVCSASTHATRRTSAFMSRPFTAHGGDKILCGWKTSWRMWLQKSLLLLV